MNLYNAADPGTPLLPLLPLLLLLFWISVPFFFFLLSIMFFWLFAQFTNFPEAVGRESLSSANENIFNVPHHPLSKDDAVDVLCLLQVYNNTLLFPTILNKKQDEASFFFFFLYFFRRSVMLQTQSSLQILI